MLLLLINTQPQKIRPAIVANVIQPPLRCHHCREVQICIHNALCISLPIDKWLCDDSPVRRNNATVPTTGLATSEPRLSFHRLNALGRAHGSRVENIRRRLDRKSLREVLAALLGHAPQPRVLRAGGGIEGRPHGDVDGRALGDGVVLEQRLGVLPAGHGADLDLAQGRAKVELGRGGQVVPGPVAKDGALHVRRLDLAALHDELALRRDDCLGDIRAVCGRALRKAQHHGDVVLSGGSKD